MMPKIFFFNIDWTHEYGINKRTGWSIVVNGHVMAELEPWLIVAVAKACWKWVRWHRE